MIALLLTSDSTSPAARASIHAAITDDALHYGFPHNPLATHPSQNLMLPVPPLCSQIIKLLRPALQEAQGQYATSHDVKLDQLSRNDVWERLDGGQWRMILADHGLNRVPEIQVGTDSEILKSLDPISLAGRENRTGGPPERFAQAQVAASRLIEQKAVRVQLPGVTLKTQQENEDYPDPIRTLPIELIGSGCPVVT